MKWDCNKICETVYGIYGKVHLRPYVNQALLWINMAENWNFHNLFLHQYLKCEQQMERQTCTTY
jgi:hypothetical protein